MMPEAIRYMCVLKWPAHDTGFKQAVGTRRLILNTIQHWWVSSLLGLLSIQHWWVSSLGLPIEDSIIHDEANEVCVSKLLGPPSKPCGCGSGVGGTCIEF